MEHTDTKHATWVPVRDESMECWHVAPASAFRNGRRWLADKIADDIRDEETVRLIAAAPEMLAALRDILDSEDGLDSPDCALYRHGIERAREAIAQTEGGAR